MELFSTPENPIPPGAIVSAVGADDGVLLRIARWSPKLDAQKPLSHGTVCVFTGRGEFIEKYFETIEELLQRGFNVVAMDWRGQGLSGRELANPDKGHIDDFSLFARDLDALAKQVLQFLCPRPWFALAHSMGAAILLAQSHAGKSPFLRMALTAPMIDLAGLKTPRLTRALAEAADILGLGSLFAPGGGEISSMMRPFADNVLTADKRRYRRNAGIVRAYPQLAVGQPTIGWVNAAFRLMKDFAEPDYPRRARTPALIFSAGRDVIVASEATARFASRLTAGRMILLPEARHEILQETDAVRDQFWAAFDAFIPGGQRLMRPAQIARPAADAAAEANMSFAAQKKKSLRDNRKNLAEKLL